MALIRHIVSLSGGRLGASSKVGVGSTFWVELALGVGRRALREPSWPEVTSAGSPNFGTEIWLGKLPYPSPAPSANNTPLLHASQQAVTPSTLDDRVMEDATTDYMNHKSIKAAMDDPSKDPHSALDPPTSKQSEVAEDLNSSVQTSLAPATLSLTSPKPARPPIAHHHRHSPSLTLHSADGLLTPFTPAQEAPLSSSLITLNERDHVVKPAKVASSSPAKRPTFIELPTTSTESSSSTPSTTFRPHSSSVSSQTATTPIRVGEGLKILVVDDDALTRRLMTRMLQVCYINKEACTDILIRYTF